MNVVYFCPNCNIPAEPIGLGNIIEPFWTRLPKFFTYPLQFQTILFVIIAANFAAFFHNSLLANLFFFVISTKYAYAILNTTAQGSLKPPEISIDFFNQDVLQVFKQYVVFALVGGAATFIFGAAGPVVGFLFLAIVILYAPTMLMVLVASNSILAALNPLVFIPIVNRIGWRYLLMYLFIFLLYSAPAAAFHYMPTAFLPHYIKTFLYFSLNLYYTFIVYHLLGYVLLQYHEEIGFDVDYEHFIEKSVPQADKQSSDPREKLLFELSMFIKDGKYEDALARIGQETQNQFGEDIELSEKYLTLLQMTQKTSELQEHGAAHLTMLVRLGKKAKAFTLYNDLYANSSDLKPPEPAQLQIAQWLRDRGEHIKARDCYVKFIQTNKGHPKMPNAYFSLAKILHENNGNTPKAKEILTGLLKTYPHHELATDMSSYLASMA